VDRQQLIRRVLIAVAAVIIVGAPATAITAHAAGWEPLVDRSGSMKPTIAVGDLLVVDRTTAAHVRPGEIITFAEPHAAGRTLTHRLISMRPGVAPGTLTMTTKGDANKAPEVWQIASTGTVARLRYKLPLPGFAAQLMDQSHLRGFVMLALALLSGGLTMFAIWRRPAPCAPAP
jgi:signal peptidase I